MGVAKPGAAGFVAAPVFRTKRNLWLKRGKRAVLCKPGDYNVLPAFAFGDTAYRCLFYAQTGSNVYQRPTPFALLQNVNDGRIGQKRHSVPLAPRKPFRLSSSSVPITMRLPVFSAHICVIV